MCFGLPIDPIRAESFTAEMPGSRSGAGSEIAEIGSQPLTAESAELAEPPNAGVLYVRNEPQSIAVPVFKLFSSPCSLRTLR